MKSQLRHCNDHGVEYDALAFVCQGCIELEGGMGSGMHLLPVNTDQKSPSWKWNESTEYPTLSPSIRTKNIRGICHSYLENGQIRYLEDSQHSLAGQTVDLVDLPQWFVEEVGDPD